MRKRKCCRVCGIPMEMSSKQGWICTTCFRAYKRDYHQAWLKRSQKDPRKKSPCRRRRNRDDAELEAKARYYNRVICPDEVLARAIKDGGLLAAFHRDCTRNAGCKMNGIPL